jgi:hypothetical protein
VAHYRRGKKVAALPPVQRHAIGAATIAVVFALVGLTAWRPAVFVVPALIVIGVLGLLDYAIVTTRWRPAPARRPAAAQPAIPDALAAAETTSMPRIVDPVPDGPPTTRQRRRGRPAGRPDPRRARPVTADEEPPDDLSWSPDEDPRLDDPQMVQTMVIDMRRSLDGGGGSVWG